MVATKEAVLVISNGEPHAIARRDDRSKKVIFYALKEMSIDEIEKLINKNETPTNRVEDGERINN